MNSSNGEVVSFKPIGSLRIGALVAFIGITAGSGMAADLWVDRNSLGGQCDDWRQRSEVSASSPWCTLSAIGDQLGPGDVVHVREGVYDEIFGCERCWYQATIQVAVSGTEEAPIKFTTYPGETVVLSGRSGANYGVLIAETQGVTPRFIEIEGFETRDFAMKGVMTENVSDVILRDLEVMHCTEGAIGILRSARVTVEGCRVHHNSLTGWTSPINFWECRDGNVIRGNYVWANTDEDPRESEGHGIILDYCEEWGDTLIENNVIWDNEGLCMNVFYSNGATIRNNTCWRNNLGRDEGTIGELWVRGENIEVFNNILVPRIGAALRISDGGDLWTVSSDYNLLWAPDHSDIAEWPSGHSAGTLTEYQQSNGHGWDANSVQIDPQIVNADEQNFALSAGSPAIDSGDDMHFSEIDVTGTARPSDGDGDGSLKVDLGAYEFLATGSETMIFVDSFDSGFLDSWTAVVEN